MRSSMKLFREGLGPHALEVSMAGVKMGDRLLQLRCGNGKMFAAIAAKVGLTGNACAIDDNSEECVRGRKTIAKAGVLAEIGHAQYDALPYEDTSFDVVVLWDLIGVLTPERRVRCLQQTLRVLRRGGRCLVIERVPRSGLWALLRRPVLDATYLTSGGAEGALDAEGFIAIRQLAERDGLAFTEGVKPTT